MSPARINRKGRGMKISVSPIKQIALERQIPCLQPVSLKDKDIVDDFEILQGRYFCGGGLWPSVDAGNLDIPKMLCMNVHGSLLPKYRGAAPVNWAILNGDKETGVTIQKMALALDAGDIIAQERDEH